MSINLKFGSRRNLTVKVGHDLAYINWSRRTGTGHSREMWLTAWDLILWHRWS